MAHSLKQYDSITLLRSDRQREAIANLKIFCIIDENAEAGLEYFFEDSQNLMKGTAHATEHHEVIVIGAGAAGLGAARRLSEAGIDFVVLEAQKKAGGRIHTHHYGGLNHFSSIDPRMI